MKLWYVGVGRLAYWLACTSSLSMVWMALYYPATHPRRLPPLPVQVVWWTLYFYAPASILLGIVACLWIGLQSRSKHGLSHAQSAVLLGILACVVIYVSTNAQIQTRRNFNHSLGSCISNEKQLALGFLMYAQDYDDRLPLASSWNQSTLPYIKNESTYRCPQEEIESLPSYGMNGLLARERTGRIDRPDATVLLIDAAPGANRLVGKQKFPFTDRHENHLNVAFADGHAKSKYTKQTQELIWEPHAVGAKR